MHNEVICFDKSPRLLTVWYGQASCTAGRASFITGRIPIRSALSIVVAPGDENRLRKETLCASELQLSSALSFQQREPAAFELGADGDQLLSPASSCTLKTTNVLGVFLP
jgi:hypothetical protein